MAEIVSGVGKNAKRTDMNPSSKLTQGMNDRMPSKFYGDTTQLNQIQAGADLQGPSYKVPKVNIPTSPTITNEPTIPLTADTLRNDELPETGMNFNKGGISPGPEMLIGTNPQSPKLSDQVYPATQADPTGETNDFYNFLIERGL
jgi:hypothetical protein